MASEKTERPDRHRAIAASPNATRNARSSPAFNQRPDLLDRKEKFLPWTRLERRRTFFVLGAAVVSLLAIAYELYAHQFVTHHPWP